LLGVQQSQQSKAIQQFNHPNNQPKFSFHSFRFFVARLLLQTGFLFAEESKSTPNEAVTQNKKRLLKEIRNKTQALG
jgi:hypothetical protein